MKCKEIKLLASVYLDDRLPNRESEVLEQHLGDCAGCRDYLTEITEISGLLNLAAREEPPTELHSYVMAAARGRVDGSIDVTQRTVDRLASFNPRVLSYGIGSMASAFLFVIILFSVRPIGGGSSAVPFEAVAFNPVIPGIVSSDAQFHAYNPDLPPDPDGDTGNHEYVQPRILAGGSLVDFSNVAYRKKGNQAASALLEVSLDGRARVLELLEPDGDQRFAKELVRSLSDRSFEPATVSGRPTVTRVILMLEKCDVGG